MISPCAQWVRSRSALFCKTILIAGCVIAAPLTFLCQTAQAQVKPFKVTGAGFVEYVPLPGDDPAMHTAVGTATHLGKYENIGHVRVDKLTGPTTAEFSSALPCVFTAANGDKLAFHYGRPDFGAAGPGVVELFPTEDGKFIAAWLAEFTPVRSASTGRYKKVVDGSFFMLAVTEPFVLGARDPVAYTWEGEGWIEFRKERKK
jgi:hypothetical protein